MTAAASPPAPVSSRAARLAPIALLLLAGLVFRIVLVFWVYPRSGLKGDVDLFVAWARTVMEQGPNHAYATTASINYPPGYLWVLWAWGHVAQTIQGAIGSPDLLREGIKVPAILADVLVAAIFYRAIVRWHGSERLGLIVAAVYLFVPVTWYDSAMWGQVDTMGVLVGGLALIWLIDRRPELATAAATAAILVKPQYAIFLPIVGIVLLRRHLHRPGAAGWLRDREGPLRLATSAIVAFAVTVVVTYPTDIGTRSKAFVGVPVLSDLAGLVEVIRSTAGQFASLSANAYNPWALVGPQPLIGKWGLDRWSPDDLPILGLPAFQVGMLLYGVVAIGAAVLLWKRPDRDGILVAAVLLATAFFVVPTRVHERYLFTAVGLAVLLLPRGRAWWAWLALGTAILLTNMHAILMLPQSWTATPGLQTLPFGEAARSPAVATAAALACIPLLLWPIVDGARLLRQRSRDRNTPALLQEASTSQSA